MPAYAQAQSLPDGVNALSNYVTVPEVLARRMSQIGLVSTADATRLQAELKPGQRLVSLEGDLWRWDGFRAGAEDQPSTAALRLEQLNRLQELKQDLEEVSARADGARAAHETLKAQLVSTTEADKTARDARRDADRAMTEANRALSRAEADRNIAGGKLENLGLAVQRHEEEAMGARQRLVEAERGVAELGDLDAARAHVEDVKMAVEAARMTMMAKRSAHDELRREGEARTRRNQEIIKEVSGWKHRLETAGKRIAELEERKAESETELADANAAPEELTAKREELADAIGEAETRRKASSDKLAEGETSEREAANAERDAERAAGRRARRAPALKPARMPPVKL